MPEKGNHPRPSVYKEWKETRKGVYVDADEKEHICRSCSIGSPKHKKGHEIFCTQSKFYGLTFEEFEAVKSQKTPARGQNAATSNIDPAASFRFGPAKKADVIKVVEHSKPKDKRKAAPQAVVVAPPAMATMAAAEVPQSVAPQEAVIRVAAAPRVVAVALAAAFGQNPDRKTPTPPTTSRSESRASASVKDPSPPFEAARVATVPAGWSLQHAFEQAASAANVSVSGDSQGLTLIHERFKKPFRQCHKDYSRTIRELMSCVYWWHWEDYYGVHAALAHGTLNGKQHSTEEIKELLDSGLFNARYSTYLRKVIKAPT